MSIVKINSKQVRFQDPTGVIFIPWVSGVLGGNGYDVHDIVGDTFSLTQDDADRTEIPWEFGDDPLDENVSLGNRNVTMQCLDFQNEIMKNLFGWDTDTDGFAVAPSQYKDLYCMIILQFEGKSVVMPKVKMDAKTTLESLRTDIARGELSGVLYSAPIALDGVDSGMETALAFIKNGHSFTVGGSTIAIAANGTVTNTALSTLEFDYEADTTGKTYTASGATGTVTADCDSSWVTVSAASTTVTVKVTENEGDTTRTAVVVVYDDGDAIGTISVVQTANV